LTCAYATGALVACPAEPLNLVEQVYRAFTILKEHSYHSGH
jgi:hypothetical protein